MTGQAVNPTHYGKYSMDKIEAIIDGLPAREAACLFNVLKYYERAEKKGDAESDLEKANSYAYRMVFGSWPWESDIENEDDAG